MKTCNVYFKITESGKFEYSGEYQKALEIFKRSNPGREGILTYTIKSGNVEYWQHKYYRGYLLPQIADFSFDGELDKAHEYLKEQFLFIKCDQSEIKHNKINKYFYQVDGKQIFIGYTPSTSELKVEEMNDFIRRVEAFGFENCNLVLDKTGIKAREFAQNSIESEFNGKVTDAENFDEIPEEL